jgi:hypothetical protein
MDRWTRSELERTELEISDPREKDAESRFLWHFPARRLEAESIRDSMLFVSGQLNLKMHGRGFNLFDQRGGTQRF